MGRSHTSTARRLVAVAATLGVAASLTVAMSTMSSAAGAEDGERTQGERSQGERAERERTAGGLLVREAPADAGSFVVRGASQEAGGLSQAALRDLRSYARTSGESYDELVASHRGVDELAAYAADLEQRRPGLYTTSGIGEAGEGAWVQVTRRPGAAEVARLRQLPVDVRVEYGAPASSAELARLSEELIDSLGERTAVVESAQASYDDDTRRMELTFKTTEAAPAARVGSAVEGALRSALPQAEGALPLPVVTREVDFVTDAEVTVQGGGNLNFQGGAACTGGFTAARKGSRGTLTARHCPNKMTYGKRRGIISNSAAQTSKKKFDLQWHRTQTGKGHKTGVQFRAYRDGRRTVRKVSNAPRGSIACHWGRTSGFSCARVVRTNQCVVLSGQKTCALDGTGRYISAPGDSGGPWFLGNTARGIHAGGGGSTSLFTRIGKTSALGARVLRR